jgi:peptidoglycan/LPS O-acetylase OafA/YrhL
VSDPNSKGRIPELDGLRGVAVLLVIIYYYFYFYPTPDHRPVLLSQRIYVFLERFIATGWSGVDLFYVLSGFLIGGILVDIRQSPRYFKTFYARRFFRIVPIYYVWFWGFIALALAAGEQFGISLHDPGEPRRWFQIAGQFLFLQNLGFTRYLGLRSEWLNPTWSLAVEEQFYLVAPLVIRFLSRRSLYCALVGAVVAAPLIRICFRRIPVVPGVFSLPYALMPCRMDVFALGILAAALWREEKFQRWLCGHVRLLNALLAAVLTAAAVLSWRTPNFYSLGMESVGYTCFALLYTTALLVAISQPRFIFAASVRSSWLRELGRVSYCMYLIDRAVHFFLSVAFHIPDGVGTVRSVVASLFAMFATYARISWKYFEYRMVRLGHT